MRSNRRQRAGLPRRVVVWAACAALLAMTSGLLLAIHLHSIEHPANHGPLNCSLCRHALIAPNKFLPAPPAGLIQDACPPRAVPTAPRHDVADRRPPTSQPRAPPAEPLYPWA